MVIGFGAIASELVQQLQAHGPRYDIGVLLRPGSRSRALVPHDISLLENLGQAGDFGPELVVEAAGHEAVREAVPALLASFPVLLTSTGALCDDGLRSLLEQTAASHGTRLLLASGALAALDYVRAVRNADDTAITYESRKPPKAWEAELRKLGHDPDEITAPLTLFEGTAREAAASYPQNLNVAAALAMAGLGFEDVSVKVVCDPALERNLHLVSATSSLGTFEAKIANNPSKANPKSSQIVAHSICSAVEQFFAPIVIL